MLLEFQVVSSTDPTGSYMHEERSVIKGNVSLLWSKCGNALKYTDKTQPWTQQALLNTQD